MTRSELIADFIRTNPDKYRVLPPSQPDHPDDIISYDPERQYDSSYGGGILLHSDAAEPDYSGGGGLDFWEERERWERRVIKAKMMQEEDE